MDLTQQEAADGGAWLVVTRVGGRGSVCAGPFRSRDEADAYCVSADVPDLVVVDATGYCSPAAAPPPVLGGMFGSELQRLAALRQRAARWVGDELDMTDADWALVKGFAAGALFVVVLLARWLWSRG